MANIRMLKILYIFNLIVKLLNIFFLMLRVGWRTVKLRVGVSKKLEMVKQNCINETTGLNYLKSSLTINVITCVTLSH